nr:Gfo/Idh/MocA family oxidoreductase [Nitrosopumilaceae archaeon]NIX62248.1 Gfo/Idh/MocA family oxidoreductase [Nitrosopumilaceae archaeon]
CSLDAVFILTPNNMHLPMSLIALQNGAHIFIERPAARNSKEARRIAETAKKYNRHVMVGMHARFRSDVRAVKKILDSNKLGDIFFIKAEWLQAKLQAVKQPWWLHKNIAGGGVLMDLGIQLIDTSWWLLNKPELESAKAFNQQINTEIEVEDFCSFFLKFSNSLKMTCHISWNFPIVADRFRDETFGTRGSFSINPFKVEQIWHGKAIDITPSQIKRDQHIFRNAYQAEISHFIQFLQGRVDQLESNIEEAIIILEIMQMIYRSLETNREVLSSDNM